MIIKGDRLSFDCETTGLKETDRPFAMSVSNGDEVNYLDERVDNPAKIKEQIEVLNNAKILIGQNIKFDLRMLSHWGLRPKGMLVDTAVLGRLVRNDHMAYGLDAQAKRYGMLKSDEVMKYIREHKLYTLVQDEFGNKEKLLHFDRVPIDIMSRYAQIDARITFDLADKLLADLDPRSEQVLKMECKVTEVCYAMERRGVLINKEYTKNALAYEEGLIREAKDRFLAVTGREYDNKKTTLVEVFTLAGETIPKTEKGNDSLTDDVLENFTSPAAEIVRTIRHYEKRIATYYKNFLSLCDVDDVIHADMWQGGTTTGRFSYRDPNLQNVPKEEESTDLFVVRGCFKPRPGFVFVSLDYKQQEYRLMLAYANHKRLISEVMAGADVHQATADLVGITRKHAKTLNFAILYGAGAEKVAHMLSISLLEARTLIDRYFNSLLEVDNLIDKIKRKGLKDGFVHTWLGRKLHVNDSRFVYKLPNYLIQGGGADICKSAMPVCHALLSGFDAHMVLQIHDALIFEMRFDDMAVLVPQLKQAMIEVFPMKNGMKMDVDVSWSDQSLAEREMRAGN